MRTKFFYTVSIEKKLEENLFQKIVKDSYAKFSSSGNQDFSLSEKEVDEILGDEAFCGGDLSPELMAKLENNAKKSIMFYFTDENAKENSRAFGSYLESLGINEFVLSECEDEDWNEEWKKHYSPIEVGDFLVLPKWNADLAKGSKRTNIIINPGMGFGTGTHETTRLCLKIYGSLKEQESFNSCLDLGSGSGILGLAYLKNDTGLVDFVDIDQRALDNNKDNFHLNFTPAEGKRVSYILRENFDIKTPYHLVFANILEHVLIEEYPLISGALSSGGQLILSGILKEQKQGIKKKYEKDFNFIRSEDDGDWSAILFRKR